MDKYEKAGVKNGVIIRYDDPVESIEVCKNIDLETEKMIFSHIENHFGQIDYEFPDTNPYIVSIKFFCIMPTEEYPIYRFITCGMSALPMTPRSEFSNNGLYSELMITLPIEWKFDELAMSKNEWNWPIAMLKKMARFPHEYKTTLGILNTYSNEGDDVPYDNSTELCGNIILPTTFVSKGFDNLIISPEKNVIFNSIVPIYKEERLFAVENGSKELVKLFVQENFNEIIDINRKNICKK